MPGGGVGAVVCVNKHDHQLSCEMVYFIVLVTLEQFCDPFDFLILLCKFNLFFMSVLFI